MIKNTFLLLEGIGEKREKRLWKEGILTWEDFFQCEEILDIDFEKKRIYDDFLYRAFEALSRKDCSFFLKTSKKGNTGVFFRNF